MNIFLQRVCLSQSCTLRDDDSPLDEPLNKYPTVATGANFYKDGEDPVLKHPSEYPKWLWTLDRKIKPTKEWTEEEKDKFSKKFHRMERKALLREKALQRKNQ